MNILNTIVEHKRKEVKDRKQTISVVELEKRTLFQRPVASIKKQLLAPNASGIIAEFKRKSPSKGIINSTAKADHTTIQYIQAGASALSVLTDENFFGGSDEDFLSARIVNICPMLRKDFVLDEYQIIEAKSLGADVILLIAASLEPSVVKNFASLAHSLGMEVLLEVHNEDELRHNLTSDADLIGVNNRNLKTFEVSIDVSKRLFPLMPKEVIKVSESGIDSVEAILELRDIGFQGFLMGQKFMEQDESGLACKNFIHELRTAKK
jgi:indole-3-glycerol phosphate synthase